MNAAFFGLAGTAALNPKLLIIDLILATNQRPRLMFVCFLPGGMGLGLTVGLLDVFVLHLNTVKTRRTPRGPPRNPSGPRTPASGRPAVRGAALASRS